MANVFQQIRKKFEPVVFFVWLVSMLGTLASFNFWAEDIASTFKGAHVINNVYDLKLGSWAITYYSLAIMPDILLNVLGYILMLNTRGVFHRSNWKLWIAVLLTLAVDMGFDLYERTQGVVDFNTDRTWVALAAVFFVYSVGSNVFLSLFLGLFFEVANPAMTQFEEVWVPTTVRVFEGGLSLIRGILGALGRFLGLGSRTPPRQPQVRVEPVPQNQSQQRNQNQQNGQRQNGQQHNGQQRQRQQGDPRRERDEARPPQQQR